MSTLSNHESPTLYSINDGKIFIHCLYPERKSSAYGFIEGTALIFEIYFIESDRDTFQQINKIHITGNLFRGIRNRCGTTKTNRKINHN